MNFSIHRPFLAWKDKVQCTQYCDTRGSEARCVQEFFKKYIKTFLSMIMRRETSSLSSCYCNIRRNRLFFGGKRLLFLLFDKLIKIFALHSLFIKIPFNRHETILLLAVTLFSSSLPFFNFLIQLIKGKEKNLHFFSTLRFLCRPFYILIFFFSLHFFLSLKSLLLFLGCQSTFSKEFSFNEILVISPRYNSNSLLPLVPHWFH